MKSAGFSRRGLPPARRSANPRARLRRALSWLATALLAPAVLAQPHLAREPSDYVVMPLPRVDGATSKFRYLFGPMVRWSGAIHWRYNAANAPAPFADATFTVARLQSAFDQWTAACGVRHVYDGPTTTPPGRHSIDPVRGPIPDFENVVGWGNPGTSIRGQTLAWYDEKDPAVPMTDADIILSETLIGDVGGLMRTAAHEFGHALGLDHSNVDDQLMSGPPASSYSSLDTVQADDIRGCRCLYGLPSGLTAPYVCSLPERLDFGGVTAGTTSAPKSVTITNSGNAPLTIGPVTANDSQFARASGCDPGTTVGPGASCTMNLTVRPNSIGGRATEIVIGTSDGAYRLPVLADGLAPPPPPSVPTATMVEYYNATLDHYFGTTSAAEQAKLDAGDTPTRWTRTGATYRVYASAQAQASALCRYYIPPALGDSHFFGRDAKECSATAARNPSFELEDAAFGYVLLPAAGACGAGTTPVYRVFSNRVDANHRYTTDRATRDHMVALGWIAEGDGADAVAMCAP